MWRDSQRLLLLCHIPWNLSALTGVITVIGAAQETGKTLLKVLRSVRKAPQGLRALIDEIAQIEMVLAGVRDACHDGQGSTPALDSLIENARGQLLQIHSLIQYQLVQTKEVVQVDRLAWAKHRHEVGRRREQLTRTRLDINTALSTANL